MRVDWTDGYVMEQGVWLLGGHLPVMGFGLVQVEKTTSTMSIVFSNTGKYNCDPWTAVKTKPNQHNRKENVGLRQASSSVE